MTLEELSALTPEMLRAALQMSEEREANERLAKRPKCRCGKPATTVARAEVTFHYYRLKDTSYGSVREEYEEVADFNPTHSDVVTDDVFVSCDDEDCQSEEWNRLSCVDYQHALNGW